LNKVRQLREDRLLTQDMLARKAGIATRTLWAIEKGRPCHMTTKRKLLYALKIDFTKWFEVFPRD